MNHEPTGSRTIISLRELNASIREAMEEVFPVALWVTAEIAELKVNQRGHCYLELVEKAEDKILAQMRGTIWAGEYRKIHAAFTKATGEALRPGMMILFLAQVTFHEVYGLSLNIRDIDPVYTLGEMARRKKEIILQLTKEGIIGLNKALPFPLVPQRVAVISSPTAAGYGDFFNQLDSNNYGYTFIHVLFPAVMQGQEAEASVREAFQEIFKQRKDFDVVAIIRGGGSAVDLSCFDNYELAAQIARFPLPVITGIGHEKDDTVADVVAHTRLKTPTAVAEFLISRVRDFEESVLGFGESMRSSVSHYLKDEAHRLSDLVQRLSYEPLRKTAEHMSNIMLHRRDIEHYFIRTVRDHEGKINTLDQALRLLDPKNILKRGYSITRHKGKVLQDALTLKKWAVLETILHKGEITSIVQEIRKEAGKHEEDKKSDILPGFE